MCWFFPKNLHFIYKHSQLSQYITKQYDKPLPAAAAILQQGKTQRNIRNYGILAEIYTRTYRYIPKNSVTYNNNNVTYNERYK